MEVSVTLVGWGRPVSEFKLPKPSDEVNFRQCGNAQRSARPDGTASPQRQRRALA